MSGKIIRWQRRSLMGMRGALVDVAHAVEPTHLAIALVLVAASHWSIVMAAPPSGSLGPRPVDDTAALVRLLHVEVDRAIEDAPLLPTWIAARNTHLVEELSEADDREQWLAVEIKGATYDYRVSVVVMHSGKLVTATGPTRCECSNEELLALVDSGIAAAAASLREMPVEHTEDEVSPSPEASAASGALEPASAGHGERLSPGTHERLGPLGYMGLGAGAVGMGLVAGGIPLALQQDQIRGEPGEIMTRSTHRAGLGLAVAGGVALAGGVAMMIIDTTRRRRRLITVAPMADRQRAGVTFTWEF